MDGEQKSWKWPKERIRALRDAMNGTQKDMAKMLGVSERTIFRWEKGEFQPRRKVIRRMEKIEKKLIRRESKEEKWQAPNIYREYILLQRRNEANAKLQIRLRETLRALGAAQKLLQQARETSYPK